MPRYEFDCACGCTEISLSFADKDETQFCDKCEQLMRRRTVSSNIHIHIPVGFHASYSDTAPRSEAARKNYENAVRTTDP